MTLRQLGSLVCLVGLLGMVAATARAGTLETVQQRGLLLCGVGEESGFAARDAQGRMQGLRAEICRALAAAVLRDPEAVTYVPLFAAARFDALREHEVDVLIGGATWTLGREASLGVHFTQPLFYDGQGFLSHAAPGWKRLADVDEALVCVVAETTSIDNLEAWMRATGRRWHLIESVTTDGAWNTFLSHGCDLMTNDRAGMMLALHDRVPEASNYVVFPDLISREPLAPAVRADDARWEAIVRFTFNALILAEEKGLTQAGVVAAGASDDPEVRLLLGQDGGLGAPLGLDDGWARRALAAVGSYGEIYHRTVGDGSPYRMPRGHNALWRDGGLLYPLPMR